MARNWRVCGNLGSMSPVKMPVEVWIVRWSELKHVLFCLLRTVSVASTSRDNITSFKFMLGSLWMLICKDAAHRELQL